MGTFDRIVSDVRWYSRSWPAVFDTADGSTIVDTDGRSYLDFFAGAGALNYGHNPRALRDELVQHIVRGGITHSLDVASTAKEGFLVALDELILQPRGYDHKVLFPGPSGTNAVEAALKVARRATGRQTVVSFTNAFHGMTLGSLAVSGNAKARAAAGVPLHDTVPMPYDGFFGDAGLEDLEQHLETARRDDLPAAVIVETVQADGGVNVASPAWMRALGRLCHEHGVLLVVDDIQVGCGRTGPFFSFDTMNLDHRPDVVCLSKSLSGYGLPLAVVLLDPALDVLGPGDHTGTFRGFDLAFLTAGTALREWWSDDALSRDVVRRGAAVRARLETLAASRPQTFPAVRGRGLIQGLACSDPSIASSVCARAFDLGLLVETAGPAGEIVKLMPPLTIADDDLSRGLDLLCAAADDVLDAAGSVTV